MSVRGVGGIFFRAQDPEKLTAWYREHLDIGPSSPNDWAWTTEGGPLVFAPFETGTDYWAADKQFMLNLRVSDLTGLIDQLEASGISVTVNPEWNSPETGRFARIHDPEGHPIELWEPPAD